MESNAIIEFGSIIVDYVQHLNWIYIISFILLAYVALYFKEKDHLKIKKRYLVAFTGIGYAAIFALVKGLNLEQINVLFQSFVFTFAFHTLFIDKVVSYIKENLFS